MPNLKLLAFILIAVAFISLSFFLPVGEWLLGFIDWVRGYGAWGGILYGVVYALLTVLLIPGSLLTLAAGFLYGPWWGLLLISPASVLGATLAFVCGRYLMRDWVQGKIADFPKFSAVDRAMEGQGFRIVALLRLSPIFPFTWLNYALGVTGVSLGSYVLGSFLGMIPGTLLYLYIGSLATSLTDFTTSGAGEGSTMKWVLYAVGLLATIAATVLVTKYAKAALKKEIG